MHKSDSIIWSAEQRTSLWDLSPFIKWWSISKGGISLLHSFNKQWRNINLTIGKDNEMKAYKCNVRYLVLWSLCIFTILYILQNVFNPDGLLMQLMRITLYVVWWLLIYRNRHDCDLKYYFRYTWARSVWHVYVFVNCKRIL